MSEIQISRQGYDRLVEELNELRTVKRPEIREAIRRAREYGDLKENSEYHNAKNDQGVIEGRITELESILSLAIVVDVPKEVSEVALHTRVRLKNTETGEEVEYSIVSGQEASMAERKLSDSAPVSRALFGHSKGDIVSITVPRGTVEYEVVDVLPLEM